jgi:hypothetical protein
MFVWYKLAGLIFIQKVNIGLYVLAQYTGLAVSFNGYVETRSQAAKSFLFIFNIAKVHNLSPFFNQSTIIFNNYIYI